MDIVEIIRQFPRFENMVSILAICEIIVRQIRARENDFVVCAVEFHVLESPAFVDAVGDVFFAKAG